MTLTLEHLEKALQPVSTAGSLLVALSGGLDSVVLLHGLCQLREKGLLQPSLRAIHVNHGLQTAADQWQYFCESLCEQLQVELVAEHLDLAKERAGELAGLENAARQARYAVFECLLPEDGVLLLAHHRDDQMETLLMRLMRGAGLRGLRSIPLSRPLGAGSLFRPLLGVNRSDLQAYAKSQKLLWVVDDSNVNTVFDRNYCRHQLLPTIEKRWPSYRDSWSKTLELVADADDLLSELAAEDLGVVKTDRANVIALEKLREYTPPRQRNLLRHWIESLGLPDLGWNRLQQLTSEVITADDTTSAVVQGDGFELRCYRKQLYALDSAALEQLVTEQDWQPAENHSLSLPANGSLLATTESGKGLAMDAGNSLTIRYRQGGESCRLVGRPNKSLKKILQESEIEPWLRERLPLLYLGDELVCVPGIGVVEDYAANANQTGLLIDWLPPQLNFEK